MISGEHVAGGPSLRGLVILYAATVVGLAGVHIQGTLSTSRFQLAAMLPLVAYAVVLVAGGRWAHRRGVSEADLAVVSGWALAGHTVLLVSVGLFLFAQARLGVSISGPVVTLTSFGFVGGLLGVLIGIEHTNWRLTARRERDARAKLERQSEVVSVLNRVLRHNVRNEANIILGYADLLDVDEKKADYVDAIERAAMEMLSKGDLARSVERLSPERTASFPPRDLRPAVDRVTDAVIREYHGVTPVVTGTVEATALVHPLFEEGIRQLVENAVEHNDSDEPSLWVDLERVDRGGDPYIQLTVEDDGPGIPSLERRTLEGGVETPLEHSQGLGLWFAAWVTSLSGGEFTIEDRAPRGTRIVVTVPAAEPDDEPVVWGAAASQLNANTVTTEVGGR